MKIHMTKISHSEGHQYGWIPDVPDHRDMSYEYLGVDLSLPKQIDLSLLCPPVYDQGSLGSCTANAICVAIQSVRNKQNLKPDFVPSRLFIYYNERVMENSIASDSGAQIRHGIKSVASNGDCPETSWPYDVAKFDVKPTSQCYLEAIKYTTIRYQRVPQIINSMKGCLAAGYPFIFGFSVYSGIDNISKTGELNMPAHDEVLEGGHAVVAVGYDDSTQRFLVRNSWGTNWGNNGYFTMPYDYLTNTNLVDDLWTIRLESA